MKKSLIVLSLVALSGCASLPAGVEATPEELAHCEKVKDCGVWNEQQLRHLAQHWFNRGAAAAMQQRQRGL